MKNEVETNETIERNMSEHLTDYNTAINWRGNKYILLNEILEIDPNLTLGWKESKEYFGGVSEDEDDDFKIENYDFSDVFQFFLSDMDVFDASFLRKTFKDVLIAYSPFLGKFVLCVDHLGCSWDMVSCEVKDKEFWDKHGEKIVLKH